jgi:hypothetical protein
MAILSIVMRIRWMEAKKMTLSFGKLKYQGTSGPRDMRSMFFGPDDSNQPAAASWFYISKTLNQQLSCIGLL